MKVGSLVLCVSQPHVRYNENAPVVGETYTVRGFYEDALFLEEIINEPRHYSDGHRECSFYIKRFRELQPPMDISELIEECQTQTISI